MSETREIHIDWDGPHTYKEVQGMNGKADYGIYQFYGHHPVYGGDTLLYIGKAQGVTFASRMTNFSDHLVRADKYWTPDSMTLCVGRLIAGDADWAEQIDLAEKLLIFAHSPAWNSQELNINISKGDTLFDAHIFNWGKHRQLLAEVSGRRYARNYPEKYNLYTE